MLKVIWRIAAFCFLTVLTQVGGVVYLLSTLTFKRVDKWASNTFARVFYRFTSFLSLYCLTTFLVIPLIAPQFGRVPLPLTETNNLQPLNLLTCLLNRHYVKPELRQTTFEVSKQMSDKFPGTIVNYLDGNFPFIDKFPLLPHLSHNDGRKLDLSFSYRDSKTKESTNNCPSFIGYGICEEPLPNEKNTAAFCEAEGYWQYSFLPMVISQRDKQNFTFDAKKTRELVRLFTTQSDIGKIFIEPHLKIRLNLTSDKIRFHGCRAVRHDDHIHVQLR